MGQLRDITRELVRAGVRRILILDGHFENQMFTVEAANLVRPRCAVRGVRVPMRTGIAHCSLHARSLHRSLPTLAGIARCC